MKILLHRVCVPIILLSSGLLHAQSSNLVVGSNSSSQTTTINSGTNQFSNTYVGYNAGASNNRLTVTGSNTLLTNSVDAYVGYGGAGNTMLISNGAKVADSNGWVGYNNTASNNSVIVTEAGSLWSNSDSVYVGNYGSGNSLLVSNGASLNYSGDILSIGDGVGSSNNSVILSGSNTTATGYAIQVGGGGASNYLSILNGAKVTNDGGVFIGFASSFNSLVLSGPGSILNSTNDNLYVGHYGSINSLIISNGGSVLTSNSYVGYEKSVSYNTYASNNSVIVTGEGSLWSNAGTVMIGNEGSGNSLVISNRGRVVVAGTNHWFSVGETNGANSNSATITGVGSTLEVEGWLDIGWGSNTGNTMTISSGGRASSRIGVIGYTNGSSSNSVLVTGADSLWTNSESLTIGNAGSGNSMIISNGATVADFTGIIGSSNTASNNRVIVTGSGSYWNNSESLVIGEYGSGNSLVVSDGASLNYGAGEPALSIGLQPGSSNNSLTLTDNNTTAFGAEIFMFASGSLSILNGAKVTNGYNVELFSGNSILVSGSGSTLNSTNGFLVLGSAPNGSSNSMIISNGGKVLLSGSEIGDTANSYGNWVNVTCPGSLWSNSGALRIGNQGSGNSLTISEGGMVAVGGISTIGFTSNSSNNSVIVEDAGSLWSNAGSLTIGNAGSGNSLTISNGGRVIVGSNSVLGNSNTSTGNYALITGSGSLWSNAGTLTIGNEGSGTVTVANGGAIIADRILIGTNGDLDFGRLNGSDRAGTVSTREILFTGTNSADYGINFNQTDTLYLTSPISGAGWVCALGTGTTVMSGSNSFSLYTKIDAGTVIAASTNALGTGYLGIGGYADRATLRLATNLTVGDFTWGSNGIVALTAGSQALTVANMTNTAGTNGGNVFEFLNPALNNNTNTLINFSSQTNFTVNSFSVAGIQGYSFGVSATNVTAFIATNANLVVSDTFVINETLTVASLTIDPSGTLRGSGTLRLTGGNLTVNGTLAPGNSPGTFYVSGGNLLMGSTAVWDQQIYSTSLYDRVVVTGSAFLNGVMNISTSGGGLQFGKYNFLSASGGITGAFSSINTPEGFRGRLLISGTEGNILIAPVSYTQLAANRNQSNVATALDSFIPATSGDQLTVSTSLDSLTASEYQQAFNAIMPTFYQQIATIAFNQANALNMQLNQRLWGLRVAEGGGFSMSGFAENFPILEGQGDGAGGGKGFLDSKKDILRPGLDTHWGMFVDGNGIFAQANSGNMLPGYNSESGGVTTGLTYKWNKNVASGIYAGYQGTYTKSGANGSGLGTGSSLIDNAVRFGVFGTYGNKDGKGLYANALAGGAYHNYQANRVIQFTGLNRTANSAPGAGELDAMLATGYDLQKGKFTYGPTASLQYTYLGVNSVNETGAQNLNFNSGGWNSSSMLSSLGAHAAYTWQANRNMVLVPQISLNWQHEFMQNPYAISGNLGGTSPTFANWSSTPIRDFLYTGVGFTVELGKKWNNSFFYNAAAGNSDLVSQNIFWSAGVKF